MLLVNMMQACHLIIWIKRNFDDNECGEFADPGVHHALVLCRSSLERAAQHGAINDSSLES